MQSIDLGDARRFHCGQGSTRPGDQQTERNNEYQGRGNQGRADDGAEADELRDYDGQDRLDDEVANVIDVYTGARKEISSANLCERINGVLWQFRV